MIRFFWRIPMNKVNALEQSARKMVQGHVSRELFAYGFTIKQVFIGVMIRKRVKK